MIWKKKFTFKGYDFFHNSKGPSRGVGILISKKLDYRINNIHRDGEDNYLLLNVTISNYSLIIGSIYGPNNNNSLFYEQLDRELDTTRGIPVILGGDWNATWDCSDANVNQDVFNMVSIPSRTRSEKIRNLCRKFKMIEPFRTLNPRKTDFTFIPNIAANTNRSRLDFFIMSELLLPKCKNSTISQALASTMFDHKRVFLDFKKKLRPCRDKIKDTILKDPLLELYIKAHTFDCYINHATVN